MKKYLTEGSAFDALIAVRFIQMLTKPFTSWDAFKLGLIDETGKTLKKPKTSEEKDSLSMLVKVVKNIKRMIEKIPGGKNKTASYAAALFLLKEEYDINTLSKLMDISIDHAIKSGIEIDSSQKVANINEILPSGHYTTESGEYFCTTRSLPPLEEFLGHDIYQWDITKTGERVFFGDKEIEKVK